MDVMAACRMAKCFPKVLNVNRTPSRPKKRKTVNLVFDEEKRREFLGGFHKRKLQRKIKAQEELEKQLKEERKRIKQDARESYKKMLVSRRSIPELDELLSKEEYEVEGHTISVLELNAADLVEKSNWIGENRVSHRNEKMCSDSETEKNSTDAEDEVIGMELRTKKTVPKKQDQSSEADVEKTDLHMKKAVKRVIRHQATKQVQKSKVFRLKQKIERQKNKKISLQRKMLRDKVDKKQKHGGKVKRKTHR
ncbi:nucleolar protein 12 [Neodiprion pinetum]|uniref:nucleolar protein 12 n=1 Tax=Neodiprion pinetum TaxID=441929 RepID=UPI001EDE2FC5|nr:nucleolar protein 12 [Neodiprion pinetum]